MNTVFSAPKRAKFCIHLQRVEVDYVKENHYAVIYFAFFLPFFLFSSSHSIVMHRETCVKGFSETTARRIFKFSTNIGYHYLYPVRQNQHAHTYHSLYSSIFLFLQ